MYGYHGGFPASSVEVWETDDGAHPDIQGTVAERRHMQSPEDMEAQAPEGTSPDSIGVTLRIEYSDYTRYEEYRQGPLPHEVTRTIYEYQFHGREFPLELILETTEILK